MDVFLEQFPGRTEPSVIARIAVSVPLQAHTADGLISEACHLEKRGVRYVSVRRQQVLRIGEHTLSEVLQDVGINISCLGYAGGFTGALGMSYERATDDVRRATDLASELRARFLVVVPGDRGLHTYNHAERTVRMGLFDVLQYAHQRRVNLLFPNKTVLGGMHDVFQPREGALGWVQQRFCSPTLRPLIVIRGRGASVQLPDGWRNCLESGGCLRVCTRCKEYERNVQLLLRILNFLARNGGVSGFDSLLDPS